MVFQMRKHNFLAAFDRQRIQHKLWLGQKNISGISRMGEKVFLVIEFVPLAQPAMTNDLKNMAQRKEYSRP